MLLHYSFTSLHPGPVFITKKLEIPLPEQRTNIYFILLDKQSPLLARKKLTAANMNVNVNKDIRFTADFPFNLYLTVVNKKHRRPVFMGKLSAWVESFMCLLSAEFKDH